MKFAKTVAKSYPSPKRKKKEKKKKKECEAVDVLINLIVEVISQCIHTSNHQIVHITYITGLFVNFSSVKLERNKRNQVTFRMQIQQCLENEARVLIRVMTARLFFHLEQIGLYCGKTATKLQWLKISVYFLVTGSLLQDFVGSCLPCVASSFHAIFML